MAVELHPLRHDDVARAEELYVASFPEAERRPWPQIYGPEALPEIHMMGIYEGDEFLGILSYWIFDDAGFAYIEHFAVDPTKRSRGIGGKALAALDGVCNGRPVTVEVEPPTESDAARRRLEFYERCRYTVISEDYLQPPYQPGLPSLHLFLMADKPVDVKTVIKTLHRQVYKAY